VQDAFHAWAQRNVNTPGVMAFGIYAPGRSTFIERCDKSLSPEALEKAWRCVTETIPVLQLNQFPTARFRFVYGEAVVHCERRHDGTCLGVFARKNPAEFQLNQLERLLTEFHGL
jgi:hypothetical protein